MLKNEGKRFERITCADDAEWLELRKQGIGGSDVAAIMGLSPWKSPLEVWLEKTGRASAPDLSGKESVAMGTELEADVLEMYKRRHPTFRVQRVNAVLRSMCRPWAQASLDAIAYDPAVGWGVVEVKTGSKESEWTTGVPLHYLTQGTHYLGVSGFAFVDFTALIGDYGLHYHEYRVLPDAEDLQAVTEAVDGFWADHVEKDVIPPHVSALPSEGKALYEIYKRSDGEMEPDDAARTDQLACLICDITDQERDAKARKTEASNELKRLVGEHKGIITPEHVITWVRSEKRDSGIRVKVRD